MAENTETQMIQNLNVLSGAVGAMGGDYQPPNAKADLVNLQKLAADAQPILDANDQKEADEAVERNGRQTIYANAAAEASDVYQYCKALDWAANDLADLQSHVREMRGGRSEPKPADDPNTPDIDESDTGGSASQRSYASVEGHWSEMCALLAEKSYVSNVSGKDLPDLVARRDAMRGANQAIALVEGASAAGRQTRDEHFYLKDGAVVESANLAKKYLRAVHSDSQAWAAVKGLEFEIPSRLR